MHADSVVLQNVARIGVAILLNGLWQGAAIALVTWLALRIFRRVNASTRYAAWCLALLAIVIVPIVTSVSHVVGTQPTVTQPIVRHADTIAKSSARSTQPNTLAQKAHASPSTPTERGGAIATPSFRFAIPALASSIAFVLWILAALAIVGRLAVALFQLERLKNNALPLPVGVRDAMPGWSAASKGHRDVRVCVSDAIEVPVAVGLFDSMVLLPSHLVQTLDASDLDQISLHELAHLLRNDDWTNGLQRVASALLFFNPAVWFVVRQLDIEREVACDDYVMQLSGAVRAYAFCLAKMAEMTAWPHHALAAPGVFVTRKSISIRIERLLASGRAIGSAIAPTVATGVAAALLALFFIVRAVTPSIALTMPAPAATAIPVSLAKPPAPIASHIARPASVAVVHMPAATTAALHAPTSALAPNSLSTTIAKSVAASTKAAVSTALRSAGLIADTGGQCVGCDYSRQNLRGHDFRGQMLTGTDFSGAMLEGARFDRAELTGADFSNADLRNASFDGARLQGCNLRGAQLAGTHFDGAQLTGCDIDVSSVAPTQVRGVLESCVGCDFTSANLTGMDLSNIHINAADFTRANFTNANLSGATFVGVDFSGASFRGARMDGAQFTGCDLSGVDLNAADFSKARMIGTDMRNSDSHK